MYRGNTLRGPILQAKGDIIWWLGQKGKNLAQAQDTHEHMHKEH